VTTIPIRCFWIVLIILLAGCGKLPPQPAGQATPTSAPTFTSIYPDVTASPTVPLTVPLPKFPLDGYVVVFLKDGDLYFQDGNSSPVKLTHVGERADNPKLSDDNQKVVFSRDDGNAYSINTDGTQEQTIITKITDAWLFDLKQGMNKGIVGFVPGTHQLLFETAACESQEFLSPCSASIFLVDTDTGTEKKLGDFGLSIQQNRKNRNVGVSPDGKMLAVVTINGMDILTIDGKVVRHNILPYKPSTEVVLFPSLFWLPDSSGLIVALPNAFYNSNAYSNFPASTIWRYMIDSNTGVQISFDPSPMLDTFQVSPDGKWIVYGGLGDDNTVYLGNLADSHVQAAGNAGPVYFSWGSDSKHFIATSTDSFLGTVGTPNLTPICKLNEWIDAGHFTCLSIEGGELRYRMAEIEAETVKIYDLGFEKDVELSLLIKTK
jgi:dipeptidyl aminopeptidase/acylaminoacyl peptidase